MTDQHTTVRGITHDIPRSEVSPNSAASGPVETPTCGYWTGFLGIVVVAWAIISLRRWGILKAANRFNKPPQFTHQPLPCSNCRFLSHNSYLRCAVHPSKVLKAEAMHCPDYWAQDSDRFRNSTYR